jgi:hypothetical protein
MGIEPTGGLSPGRPPVLKAGALPDATPRRAKVNPLISGRKSLSLPDGRTEPPPEMPPDLAAVVAAWPALPEAIRAAILALVRSAAPSEGGGR